MLLCSFFWQQMLSASALLSYASTGCWLVALAPQLCHNYAAKSVDGLSPYFMILWFLGDSCNLIGCMLTQQLPFQTFLAAYFTFNDVVLDLQYWYYHNVNKKRRYSDISLQETPILDEPLEGAGGYFSTDTTILSSVNTKLNKLSSYTVFAATAVSSISPATALPLNLNNTQPYPESTEVNTIGVFFAWLCTIIYCCSRLPQLYHNYQRKSVEGVSPLLFTFALLGNLTYSLSIFYSEVPSNLTYTQFLYNELPYLLGSLGTVLFDGIYFLQRELYRSI